MDLKIKKTLIISMLCSAMLTTAAHSENSNSVSIDVMSDARIFAQFDQEIPAVVNYFTKMSEQNIIDFYQGKYGSPNSSVRLKGRLTQKFNHDGRRFRVVISQQDNYRQVDVIVTK